jgi:alpha-tubulin suppressor-like RCC1 family protein
MNSRKILMCASSCFAAVCLAGCVSAATPAENPGSPFDLPTYAAPTPTAPAAPTPEPSAPARPAVRAISAGYGFTLALTEDGAVKCWGIGYLCDGSDLHRTAPVDKPELTSGVIAIAAGGGHACALMQGGGVKCWGRNNFGQLGNDTRDDSSAPVDVVGLSGGVAAIAVGGTHACALTTGGGVKCWGSNNFGELGDGTFNISRTPVDALGLTSGVVAIAAGGSHTCAVLAGGGVKCWGYNGNGQLGNQNTVEQDGRYHPWPTEVAGLTEPVVEIAAGLAVTCVRTVSGAVKCFGQRGNGQLGDGVVPEGQKELSGIPVDVIGLPEGAAAIAVGGTSCALTVSGAVYCWGPEPGAEDPAVQNMSFTPVPVSGITGGALAVSAGDMHVCVLTGGGAVKCWGNDLFGQLGDGTENNSPLPVEVAGWM